MKIVKRMLSAILRLRGIHFLATRFGPASIKARAFDEKYRSGVWNFSQDGPKELADAVVRHAKHGDLLIMGCGSASILQNLAEANFSSVLGVDLSAEALELARHRAGPKVTFEQRNMVTYQCNKTYNVILFSESINYVPNSERRRLLARLCTYLKPDGVIIVTIAQAKRYESIIMMIRQHFEICEDRGFAGSERHLLVFRPLINSCQARPGEASPQHKTPL